jgi:hypothetical protein
VGYFKPPKNLKGGVAMWLRLYGRNKEKDSRVVVKTTFYELSLKEFNILEAVIKSLLDSTNIEVITLDIEDDIGYGYKSHYDVIVVQNEKYKLKIYYHNFFKHPYSTLDRLILKLIFREEQNPKVIILQILDIAEGLEIIKKKGEREAEWVITLLRKRD